MKKLIDVGNRDLENLVGKRVTFFGVNYIYVGDLIGINDEHILLKDPAIVYETGPFEKEGYSDEQSLCIDEFFIRLECVESFGVLK